MGTVPIIRKCCNDQKWETITKVIHIGWKQTKYFPIKLTPVFVEGCIYGEPEAD